MWSYLHSGNDFADYDKNIAVERYLPWMTGPSIKDYTYAV